MTRILPLICFLFMSCSFQSHRSPPSSKNACSLMTDNKDWFVAAFEAQEVWGVPLPIMLAFIEQESSFRADARPLRAKSLLNLFASRRISSAYGYSQALNGTWDQFVKENNLKDAKRTNFEDSVHFIGWFNQKSYAVNKIPKTDAYKLYLNYHEGHRGYRKKTHKKKKWLLKIANKVAKRSHFYERQLESCQDVYN